MIITYHKTLYIVAECWANCVWCFITSNNAPDRTTCVGSKGQESVNLAPRRVLLVHVGGGIFQQVSWRVFSSSFRSNILRPEQCVRRFAHALFKCIFANEDINLLIQISPQLVFMGPIADTSLLIQVMSEQPMKTQFTYASASIEHSVLTVKWWCLFQIIS